MPPRKLDEDKVHVYILCHVREHGRAPTYREIAAHFGVAATTARRYVMLLRDRHLIRVRPGHRGIVVGLAR